MTFIRRFFIVSVLVVCGLLTAQASTPTFPNNFTFKGFYRITNQGGIQFSAMSAVTYITNGPYAGSWFGVLSRTQLFRLVNIHMPDDASGYVPDAASTSLGCSSTPNSGNSYNLGFAQTNQTKACAMSLATDFGLPLCSNLSSQGKVIHSTCTPPAPFTGIFTDQFDSYGLWWDSGAQRLYMSYGDFYSCSTNEVVVSIDISGGPGNLHVYGPWIFSVQGTQLTCSEAEHSFRNAPVAITGSNNAQILAARNTGLTNPCANAAGCNAQQTVTYTNGGGSYLAQSVKSFFVTGEKASGDGGAASWGPDLFLCDQPADSTPADTLIDCLRLLYWKQPNSGLGVTVTDDLGAVHPNIQMAGSRILRRDHYGLLLGHNANGSLPGTPLDAAVPYGRWWRDTSLGIGSSTALANEGWAPGVLNAGDIAGHWWCLEEGAATGCFYFGSYAIGYQWYGLGTAYSDDFDACSTPANQSVNTCSGTGITTYPPGSQTKFVGWDGTNSSHYGAQSVISTISVANPTVITTATPHGYTTGQTVWIGGLNGGEVGTRTTPVLLGAYTATVTGANTFTVPVNVTVSSVDGVTNRQTPCGGVGQPTCVILNAMTAPASVSVSAISAANPTHITTSTNTFSTGDLVWFANTNSTPVLSGPYAVTKIDTTHFTIPVNVTGSGNAGIVTAVGPGGTFNATGRWLQSISFAASSTAGDVCGVDGTGSRTTTGITTGYNPCRYVYGRRNGGKGYNSEWTVPAIWSYNLADLISSLEGTYNSWNTGGSGHTTTAGLTYYNVDQSDFQVLNSLYDSGNNDILSMSAAYPRQWAYNNNTDNYNEKTPRTYANFEVYWRPTSGTGGPAGRVYVMNDSNVTNTLVVDVLDYNAAGCTDTAPVAPTSVATTAQSSQAILVCWSGSSDNNFQITRCPGGSASCQSLSSSGSGPVCPGGQANSFLDTGLAPSTTYSYAVAALNLCNAAAAAAPVNGTTAAGPPINAGGTRIKGVTSRKGHHNE